MRLGSFSKAEAAEAAHFIQPESSKSLNSLASIPVQNLLQVDAVIQWARTSLYKGQPSPVNPSNSLPLSLQSRENLLHPWNAKNTKKLVVLGSVQKI
jgi:hypothetical protein